MFSYLYIDLLVSFPMLRAFPTDYFTGPMSIKYENKGIAAFNLVTFKKKLCAQLSSQGK